MNDEELSNPLYSKENLQHMDSLNPVPSSAPPAPMALTTPLPLLLGPENAVTTCPHCLCAVKTKIKHSVTSRTHMVAALCFFICCCCCLPYCCNSARNTDHYCPNCLKFLGTYEK